MTIHDWIALLSKWYVDLGLAVVFGSLYGFLSSHAGRVLPDRERS
jgi:hypothetical protein